MTTSSAEITKQILTKVGDMNNVIISLEWMVTIDDGTRVTKHAGVSSLNAPVGNFIEFPNVTDAQKLEWAFALHNGKDAFVERMVNIMREAGDQITYDIPAPLPHLPTFKVRKVSV